MANELKPIKRTKELTPLSKDHHEGLLLGWKIKQGLKNGTDESTIAEYVKWFWNNHLDEHFREEEEILAPYLPAENSLVSRMFDEHIAIKKLALGDALKKDALLNFAELLTDHIRFEERELFGWAEKVLSPDDLQIIGHEISNSRHHESPRWDNEFWLKK